MNRCRVSEDELDHDLNGTWSNIITDLPESGEPIETLPLLYTCLECLADDVTLEHMPKFNVLEDAGVCDQCFNKENADV